MKVTIEDGRVKTAPSNRNIVDVADRAGIGIPAPCCSLGPENRPCPFLPVTGSLF